MAFFRQYIAPLLIVLAFLFALVVVSARIFLPSDMAQPAVVEESAPPTAAAGVPQATQTPRSPSLSLLIHGLPDDPRLSAQF